MAGNRYGSMASQGRVAPGHAASSAPKARAKAAKPAAPPKVKGASRAGHPHGNLGGFLHPRRGRV